MRIKNVSSTNITLPEFNLNLKPGDVGDLSSFDQKIIHTHKLLAAYFEKGLLVNIGMSTPSGSKAALKSARDRIAKLKIGDYVIKQATKPRSSNRAKIAETLKKTNSRVTSNPEYDSDRERYHDEYYANMNPKDPQSDKPIPRPKIDDKFKSMQVNYDGTITQFGSYGTIATEVLTGPTTYLQTPVQPKSSKNDLVKVKDKVGNEYNVSLSNIKEKMERKCIGSNASGKACGKWAVHGFNSCLTHMSRSEKAEYEQLRKNTK